MSTSLGNAYNVTNLFYSGTFALRDGDEPAVWQLNGFGNTGASTYELRDRGLEVALGSRPAARMTQDFAAFTAPLILRCPCREASRHRWPPGYQTENARNLPAGITYTAPST